jgi:chloramphenicol-sensitive protein RarD
MKGKLGIVYAVAAYSLWGALPVFWKTLQTVPATEIIGHRMLWSAITMLIVLRYKYHWKWLRGAVKKPVTLLIFSATACLLAVNWLTYVWAVNSGMIVDASLGYFINPLLTVLLGVIFLRERPRLWQWIAIMVAAIGILYLTINLGQFPWIGLTLATTFGLYGLLRKTATLNAVEGLWLETAILFFPALAYLIYLESLGVSSFGHVEVTISVFLVLTGGVTTLPLFFFVAAAREISLTSLGLLHYIAPTLQFLLGIFVYGEAFSTMRFIGFVFIWIALMIYSIDGIVAARKKKKKIGPIEHVTRIST